MSLSKSLLLGATVFVIMIVTNVVYATVSTTSIAVTPAEISTLATVAAIDKNEILLGDIALHKKITPGIAALAQLMIDQHGANLTQILEMANQLHALPLISTTAMELTAEGNKAMVTLGALQGKQFDQAYVNAMVSGHEDALKLIDQHLMKTAQSPEIKKFMMDTRAAVVMHLAAAKKLQ